VSVISPQGMDAMHQPLVNTETPETLTAWAGTLVRSTAFLQFGMRAIMPISQQV
jgi:hypothetical protein